MILPITLRQPSNIEFGEGARSKLAMHCTPYERIFIVCDPALVAVAHDITDSLQSQNIHICSEVEPEPKISTFESILKLARLHNPEMFIAIGGGSTIDLAKLLSIVFDTDETFRDIAGIDQIQHKRNAGLIALPTTSGTGSEVSPIAILTDTEQQLKIGAVSPELIPDVAIIDPNLTISMPSHLTAATGMDAMTHCIEAFTNRFAHPVVDCHAVEGIRHLGANIVEACEHGDNIAVRTAMSLGSLYGGLCLGSINTAAVHALAYPLGGEFGISHGTANSLLLPYVMEFNVSCCIAKYAQIARVLGCKQRAEKQLAYLAIDMIRELSRKCNIPEKIKDLGIKANALEHMARSALKVTRLLNNNPRTIKYDDALEIYTHAYKGTSPKPV
ncbi:MAG: iron-containing alcohol dehydrogenase [Chitinivibrionales bacterium]|nr:iron-containing alcohol dehydrogenase [Chitinivibrionales bacterium]